MRLDRVAVRYGFRAPWVLRDVTLDVPEGRLIRAEGGNGGGKSTLLRLAAGVCEPTRGSVRQRPARTAYVPERFPGALPFTAHDYLCHLGRVHGLRGAEPGQRATALLDRFGAGAFARTRLGELSKGTCQKVAVAQALMGEPGLLVLDEAWTGLDQEARGALDGAVTERLDQGCTVLFVDHDPTRLAGLPSARWRVGDGVVVVDDTGRPGRGTTVRITVSGRADGTTGLSRVKGVLTVAELRPRTVGLTVEGARSDEVLRALLTDPSVHVERVEGLR